MSDLRQSKTVALARAAWSRYGTALWTVLVATLGIWFVVGHEHQVARMWVVVNGADPALVAIALALASLLVLLHGLTYRLVLQRLGHDLGVRDLVPLHLRRVMIGTVSPVGGPPSLFLLVRGLGRLGVPPEDALLAATWRSVAGLGALAALLVPTVCLRSPSRVTLAAAALPILGFGLALAALVVAIRPGQSPARVGGHPRLPPRVRDVIAKARRHHLRPIDLLRPVGLTLAIKLGGAALLYAGLRAVGDHSSAATPLLAYGVGTLVLLAAPAFGGMGVVEATTAVTLERLGVPGEAALGAVVLARGGEFWLPLSLGFVAQLGSTGGRRVGPATHRHPPVVAPRQRLGYRRIRPVSGSLG